MIPSTSNSRAIGAVGAVEVFERDRIAGWVEVPPGAAPVEVGLFVDNHPVHRVWPGRTSHGRHGDGEVREFEFVLAALWDYVGPVNRITVRVGATLLPICGHGVFGLPETRGERSADELIERLAAGEAFTRTGGLRPPRESDVRWQRSVLALYTRLRVDASDIAGYGLTLAYGTLLGAIRDGGFIGHDPNFDCAIVSQHRDGPAAAADLLRIALALIDRGYRVSALPAAITVADPDDPGVAVNLYHLYRDQSGSLRFPHGVISNGSLESAAWLGGSEVLFAGAQVAVPTRPEVVLEHVYGPGWQTPDPSFRWSTARQAQAKSGLLPPAAIEEIYWADFYARTTYTTGSTFFELVHGRPDLPGVVVDIGCGDGRDSYAFARGGRNKVTGLDRSHVGVRQAGRKADALGMSDRLFFESCDVGDADRLHTVFTQARDGDAPMLFYARFFLHSIPEDVQQTLLKVLAACARSGDHFAAEFRTDRDESVQKVHGNHYRRFQNGPTFGRVLRERYGFTPLLEQEGNGFSPYQGEDPHLYRVIASRN